MIGNMFKENMKNIEERIKMCDYKSFVEDYNNLNITTHDVRRLNNLNSREYMEIRKIAIDNGDIPKVRHMNQKNANFYSRRSDGTYDVQKQYNNKKLYIGRFSKLEDAKYIVELCIEKNWIIDDELEGIINELKCKPKNYSLVNGYYVIQKSVNGRNEVYATLNPKDFSEDDVICLVNKFRNVNWKKSAIESILCEELN